MKLPEGSQLGELVGMARAEHRFNVQGVIEEIVENTLYRAQAFCNKGVGFNR